jgi:signal transduction histidine kinase
MLAAILLLNAFLGVLLAAIVIRAAYRRRANQLFALACTLDVAVTGTMGISVALGGSVASPALIHACNVGRVAIVHPILELAYAFPVERSPPRAVRVVGLVASAMALFLAVYPPTVQWFATWSCLVFFLPYFIATIAVVLGSVRIMQRSGDAAGALAILGALSFRWSAELLTYMVVRPFFPAAFPAAFTFDATAAVLVGYVVIAYAVLRYRFFRVRGLVAEGVLYGSLALSALALVGAGVDLAVAQVKSPAGLRFAVGAVSLVPLAAWLLLRRYGPNFEDAILARFDPRRAARKSTLERVLRETSTLVDPGAMIRSTCDALASLSGGRVAFLARDADGSPLATALPAALPAYLEEVPLGALHLTDLHAAPDSAAAALRALGADLVVPARFEARLLGALAVHGGTVDQDTTSAACALASHLASKLAHHALYRRAFDLQRQLDEANRLAELGAFAAAIAHDIRTPLTSVQMNVQMIRAKGSLPSDDEECVDIALEELTRMARYVSEILDYSKPVQLQCVEIEIPQLLEQAVRGATPLLATRSLRLTWDPPAMPLPTVRADVHRIRQVIENLVENAANASPPGHEIRLEARAIAGGRVAIDVIDFGRGIAPEDVAHVFKPFFTTRADGTGLGLAIVRKLVTAHEGEVTVRSEPGRGTTVTVVLPA